jgi:hypothetical protein
MTDTERLDWLAEVATETPIEIRMTSQLLIEVQIGRIAVPAISLREAIDKSMGFSVGLCLETLK